MQGRSGNFPSRAISPPLPVQYVVRAPSSGEPPSLVKRYPFLLKPGPSNPKSWEISFTGEGVPVFRNSFQPRTVHGTRRHPGRSASYPPNCTGPATAFLAPARTLSLPPPANATSGSSSWGLNHNPTMMQTFSRFRFPHAVLTILRGCPAFPGRHCPCSCRPLCGRHLSAGQAGPPEKQKIPAGTESPGKPPSAGSQQTFPGMPVFPKPCGITKSHNPPLSGRSPDPRQKNGRRTERLGATAGLSHEILLDGGRPLQ